jgi:hypothetical protein
MIVALKAASVDEIALPKCEAVHTLLPRAQIFTDQGVVVAKQSLDITIEPRPAPTLSRIEITECRSEQYEGYAFDS